MIISIFFILLDSTHEFSLCEDNVDKTIKQRIMIVAIRKPGSFHYFQLYAVADRIDFSHLSNSILATWQNDPKKVAVSLQPAPNSDLTLHENIPVLKPWVLFTCNNLAFINLYFDGVIDWHIKLDKKIYNKDMFVDYMYVHFMWISDWQLREEFFRRMNNEHCNVCNVKCTCMYSMGWWSVFFCIQLWLCYM